MLKNLCKEVQINRVESYLTSTGTGAVYGDQVDMQNYDGATFIHCFGTTAGSTGTFIAVLVGTNTSTAASTSYASISGTSVSITATTAGATQKYTWHEVYRPRYRYLKSKITRTGKTVFHGTLCLKYGPRLEPVTHDATNVKGTPVLVQST